ncbi:MAG: amidohydrolase/deacetylase family metallohydrolase, partial [Chloroflexota bacterium]|nr:amidohydrolase/deacetylase family metallohydrolase [Chloroflexota bacterium]
MPTFDLLLRGGQVIDPGQGVRGVRDVALAEGKVAAVAERLPQGEAREVIDVSGKLVTPGLIDIHGHFYPRVFRTGADPDDVCLPNGVTTAVDAGSAGWATFIGWRDYVVPRTRARLYAFLHLCATGLTSLPYKGELEDLDFADVAEAVRCAIRYKDYIVGIKVRLAHDATGERNALPALERAREAAEKAQTRVMVHVGNSPVPLKEILNRLRPGDIVTHIFHGHEHNVLDWERKVRPEVRAAQERGVILDVAHALVHFDINVARAALDQGLRPNTLSTDITRGHPPTFDLLWVMSTMLALGMTLEEVVRGVTSSAAAAIGKGSELGSLRPGAPGDVAVLEVEKGSFTFDDWASNQLQGKERLRPVLTVRGGQRW